MSSNPVLRINAPNVINETMDGESVIVNLKTGYYYSLVDTGAVVWEALARNVSREDLLRFLKGCFRGDGATIEADVQGLLTELEKEGLIIADAGSKPGDLSELQPKNGGAPEFTKPVLEKFGDMKDLLLLDPIHEVDDEGWPHGRNA